MSKFRTSGPIFGERGTCVNGTPFTFGPAVIGDGWQMLVYSLTWSGVTTSSTREALELYSLFGVTTFLAARYHLAQSGFGNLQQPVGFVPLLAGCRGRVIAATVTTPPTYDVNVAYRIVRIGGA